MQQISCLILAASFLLTEGVIAGPPSRSAWTQRNSWTTKSKTTTTTSTPFPPITTTTTISTLPACKTQTGCVDYGTFCGTEYVTWGGCFTSCPGDPRPSFPGPPCTYTSTTWTPATTTTTTPPTTTTTASTTPACSSTRCETLTNSCSMTYGGCYKACEGYPQPTWVVPICTPTSSSTSITTTTTTTKPHTTMGWTTSTASVCSSTICETLTNDCSMTYGGCYKACPGYGQPTWAAPRCSTTATTSTTTHPAPTL